MSQFAAAGAQGVASRAPMAGAPAAAPTAPAPAAPAPAAAAPALPAGPRLTLVASDTRREAGAPPEPPAAADRGAAAPERAAEVEGGTAATPAAPAATGEARTEAAPTAGAAPPAAAEAAPATGEGTAATAAAPAAAAPAAAAAGAEAPAAGTAPPVEAAAPVAIGGEAAAPAAEAGAAAAVEVENPREAIASVASAVSARAATARVHTPAGAAAGAAQAAAKNPATEQRRGAATSTVAGFAAAKPGNIDRSDFKTRLKAALLKAVPRPETEAQAQQTMDSGAQKASGVLQGQLHGESQQAAGPMAAATDPAAEVNPAGVTVEAGAPLSPEQAGAPPAPVAAGGAVPPPVPPAKLDYSADRAPTDALMAENNVTPAQLENANEPEFAATAQARQGAMAREAQMPGEFRAGEAEGRAQAEVNAAQALGAGLAGVHGTRTARVGAVGAQQTSTRDTDAAERTRITNDIDRIKTETRTAVQVILATMETGAADMFQKGLALAEAAYKRVFDEEKGGVGTWLTTWGSDWENLIERSLAAALRAYDAEVSKAVEAVATYVEGKLAEARQRVVEGSAAVDRYVAGLDANLRTFGEEARKKIAGDFEAMTGEIDQRRDKLVDTLAAKYAESRKGISALEQKLRDENKSLWQRVYDATVGVIKTILAFKDMLLGVLARAAGVIDAIISNPIGFLGNLIAGVKAGLDKFVGNIAEHLKKGLMGWLFGALEGAGLTLPDTFDLKGILSIVLQVLGLTYANIRARAVKMLGEPMVSRLERVAEIFKVLITEGPAGLWRMLLEKLANIKDMVLEGIRNWVIESVIKAGIVWLISLLNPASAFVKACKAIYDIVMFFIERGQQILALVNAILDTLQAIVTGNIAAMASKVDEALGRILPVAISFLASLLGLGGISDKIREIIQTIQAPVNAAIDWVIGKAVQLVKAAGSFFGGKKREAPGVEDDDPAKAAGLAAGLAEIDVMEEKAGGAASITQPTAQNIANQVKGRYPVFQSITVVDAGKRWDYEYVASPPRKKEGPKKLVTFEIVSATSDYNVLRLRGATPLPSTSWQAFEQVGKGVAAKEVLPAVLPEGTETDVGRGGAPTKGALLTPSRVAEAIPAPGEPARLFNEPRVPSGGAAGFSKPDLLAITSSQIITIEFTLKSRWSVTEVGTERAGERLHKRSQASNLLLNLQPVLLANPALKVVITIVSDAEPDDIARDEMTTLARGQFSSQISSINWIVA